MASPFGYEPVLSGAAAHYLAMLPRSKQRQGISLMYQLAQNPSQAGDYSVTDDSGRVLQNLMVGDWHFTFWADHFSKEMRIVDVEYL